MEKLTPTWSNKRIGVASLARRLDRFLIKEHLLEQGYTYRQWVGSGGLSDHFPIHLEICGIINKPRAPFKFNSSWLNDISYTSLVTDFWKTHPPDRNRHITEGFVTNLKELKKISKIWAHNKRYDDEHRVNEIEKEIANLEENNRGTFPSPELRDKLVELTALRGKILKDKEETW